MLFMKFKLFDDFWLNLYQSKLTFRLNFYFDCDIILIKISKYLKQNFIFEFRDDFFIFLLINLSDLIFMDNQLYNKETSYPRKFVKFLRNYWE